MYKMYKCTMCTNLCAAAELVVEVEKVEEVARAQSRLGGHADVGRRAGRTGSVRGDQLVPTGVVRCGVLDGQDDGAIRQTLDRGARVRLHLDAILEPLDRRKWIAGHFALQTQHFTTGNVHRIRQLLYHASRLLFDAD